VGLAHADIVLDATTDYVYVSDHVSAAVSVINGATCNTMVTTGCKMVAPEDAVTSGANGLGMSSVTNTVYVASDYGVPVAEPFSILKGQP
jgi:hypothetical protein